MDDTYTCTTYHIIVMARGHGYSFSFTLRALEESGLGFSVNGGGFMRANHIRGLASSQALWRLVRSLVENFHQSQQIAGFDSSTTKIFCTQFFFFFFFFLQLAVIRVTF